LTAASQPPAIICEAPRAIDGDTMRCANIAPAIRLAGIDAPELPGHCRRGRQCAPGNPITSRDTLASLLASGPVRVRLNGSGGYDRALGWAWAGPVQINCAMIASGQAVRRYGRLRCPSKPSRIAAE
jgi:endonuclease YncB( thermonuclease family)